MAFLFWRLGQHLRRLSVVLGRRWRSEDVGNCSGRGRGRRGCRHGQVVLLKHKCAQNVHMLALVLTISGATGATSDCAVESKAAKQMKAEKAIFSCSLGLKTQRIIKY